MKLLKSIARARLWAPGFQIDWGYLNNPYMVAFRCLLDMFHLKRSDMSEIIPLDEKIDFFFDNQSEKKAIISSWENYVLERPDETRKYYGATPRFEDDEEFLPLQAADFWAWWVRKWCVEGTPEKILKCDFGIFEARPLRKLLRIDISFDENQLVVVIRKILRRHVGITGVIYDVQFSGWRSS